MKLKVIVHPSEEGGYLGEIPALRGCVSQGETLDELVENLRDAVEGWLEVSDRT